MTLPSFRLPGAPMNPLPLLLALLAAPSAHAHPEPRLEVSPTPVDLDGGWRPVIFVNAPPTPDEIDAMMESIAAMAPFDALHVDPFVSSPGGLARLEDLLPPAAPAPQKGAPPPSAPITHPGRADGALSGRAVYLSQCHGFIWYESLNRFSTQRGNLFDTVEDLHNPEAMNQFLGAYLENAGAATFAVKERDHNPAMSIVDNDDGDPAAYQEIGAGFDTGARGWATPATLRYGDDPFRQGTSRRMPASGGGVARFTVVPPVTGHQAIYVAWLSSNDHASDAHYRIHHPGGVIDRTFDQRVHGSTWQYVETLYLYEGEPVVVELIADSREQGRYLSIDAVRIGGGTGVVERYGKTTGRPRWEEGALLATQFNGAPTSVYDAFSDGRNGNDVTARSRWAAWESPPGEDAIYLSWHSNASAAGTARGTVTYIYEGSAGPPVAGSLQLATAVQQEMVDVFRREWEPGWQDRGVKSAAFGEVNPSHNRKMPAALVELAFHDNATDATYLKHPAFRRDAARAMYRGIVRYFAERDRVQPVFLPEPPVGLQLLHGADGHLHLSWQPGAVGAPNGDAPSGYLVQLSADGYAFDEGFAVTGTTTRVDARPGQTVFARVVATNAGGVSFASEVVGARRSPDGWTPVLVVGAFDRFETGQLDWEQLPASIGNVRRMRSERVNPYNVVVPHGRAVADAGWYFDAIADERLPEVDLSRYRLVIWATGEESTVDETFSTAQQRLLRPWWSAGGAIFASGAEILWDLDHRGNAEDKAFALEVLGASMLADSAGTSGAGGVGPLEGLDLSFPAGTSPYPIEWPDVLQSSRTAIARYDTGALAGALGDRVALFGFPFESIGAPAVRADVMRRLLPELVPGYEPPVPSDDDDPADPVDPGGQPPDRARIGELRGCGCSSGSGAPTWAPALALAALSLRRCRRG
jgi:hypothetical protein